VEDWHALASLLSQVVLASGSLWSLIRPYVTPA
jgi:hypothetical protein